MKCIGDYLTVIVSDLPIIQRHIALDGLMLLLSKEKEEALKAIRENERWKNAVNITEAALGISGLYATKDKQIDELKAEINNKDNALLNYPTLVEFLENVIKHLKCCGNCIKFTELTICGGKSGSNKYCDEWDSDKLIRSARIC